MYLNFCGAASPSASRRVEFMTGVFESLGNLALVTAYRELLIHGKIPRISSCFDWLNSQGIVDVHGWPTYRATAIIAVTHAQWRRLEIEDWLQTDIRDTSVAIALEDIGVRWDHKSLDMLWEGGKTYGEAMSDGDLEVEDLRTTDFFDYNADGTLPPWPEDIPSLIYVSSPDPTMSTLKHAPECMCMKCMFPAKCEDEV